MQRGRACREALNGEAIGWRSIFRSRDCARNVYDAANEMPSHSCAAEKEAESLFRKVKAALIRRLGRGPLSSATIDSEGRALFGSRYGGSGDQTRIKLEPDRFYIVNTSYTRNSPGFHWVAIAVSRTGIIYMYDSYARSGARIMSRLVSRIHKKGGTGRHVSTSDPSDKEQLVNSAVCGHLSLAWLIVVRALGLRQALLI